MSTVVWSPSWKRSKTEERGAGAAAARGTVSPKGDKERRGEAKRGEERRAAQCSYVSRECHIVKG